MLSYFNKHSLSSVITSIEQSSKTGTRIPKDIFDYVSSGGIFSEELKSESDSENYQAIRLCCEYSHEYSQFTQIKKEITDFPYGILIIAIKNNSMPLFYYVIDDLGYSNEEHLRFAVEYGRIIMLQYILDKNPEWLPYFKRSTWHCEVAARNGDIELLIYLREKLNVEWYCLAVFDIALMNRHFDCIMYAIKHSDRIGSFALENVILSDSIELLEAILKYHSNNRFISEKRTQFLNVAIKQGNIEIVKCMHAAGFRPNYDELPFFKIAKIKNASILFWKKNINIFYKMPLKKTNINAIFNDADPTIDKSKIKGVYLLVGKNGEKTQLISYKK